MKIEIWSDIVCPFCYIGKRKLEKALAKFPNKEEIEIEWKSFQLNPEEKTNPSISTIENLAKGKGWSLEQAKDASNYVTEAASKEGLTFDFDKSVVANTLNGHRMIHLAQAYGKGSEMKERLLKAYFTDGLNVDDIATLKSIAVDLGLDAEEAQAVLDSNKYLDEVNQDIYESRLVGVRGVPFFVLDRKYGISGAQPDEVFDDTLKKAWSEFSKNKSEILLQGSVGEACDIDGNC